MIRKCYECGGSLHEAVHRDYDFSTLAGIPARVAAMPVLRCRRCGEETLDGKTLQRVLDRLALDLATAEHRLPPLHACFLRKHLQLTQKELAGRMGVDRVTVAKWESGEKEMSPQHDFILRSLTIGSLAKSGRLSAERIETALSFVRRGAVPTAPPLVIQDGV